ncbi:MFS transporter [Sphingomonas sanxanigenens]|uniref:Major facilitator superfamily (MFS) profile domain-containing protein n=1 Tax=Sphingomonas sanxanigenens DSM 19645 = NX02 TaxID=1123269 RepID=W0AAX9_9SPHN|nr:MFS transporter [Sphingomonas sanxanigenens]AHE54261.1 hypothetical protein NX02_12815 [Sphingomonas sanxanigenens DSM 19645 = NX02]
MSIAAPHLRYARSNIARLAIAQALAGANSVVLFATGAILGHELAPSPALATLPISIFVVGMAAFILPAGAVARRHGRRTAFLLGTVCGVLVGLLSMLAVMLGSFWLLCLGAFFGGAYAAVVQSFRFAAADCVEPDRRPQALSIVMAGGVVAGVLGPQLVTLTMDLWPAHMFAATFIAQSIVALLSAAVLAGVRLPLPTAEEIAGGRPIAAIVRQPGFAVAVMCGAVSYMVMNFLMTAAPLAMRLCGHSQASSNLGLQWHIIAMYGPSFFTGRLITRFGAARVAIVGFALIGMAVVAGLRGIAVADFWLTLILLGIGWNFSFVGASTMVLDCHRPEEKAQVQSLNDFIIFGLMAVGSFTSGELLTLYGWDMVLWVSTGPLAMVVLALIVVALRPAPLARPAP